MRPTHQGKIRFMLNFSQLAVRRGPRLLFENVNFIIHSGQKVGLTGGNGTGKSTLFALIFNDVQADSGDFSMPPGLSIAHVAQHTPSTERSALEYALDGDTELREVQAALLLAEADDDGQKQAELHGRLEHIGGYEANSRAARLLHGLGFGIGEEDRPVSSFSGGWRMRLNLAQALMCRSDLLLLDEPTNHLDLDAVIWLEDWLKAYQGTLILISHDRDFLDKVVGHIAHVEQQGITLYTGNYTAFEGIRAERLANQSAAHAKQQREVAHMHSYVERFRAKASKAKQAQSRLKALARMEMIAPAHVDSPFHYAFRKPDALPDPLLSLDKASAGYGDTTIIDKVKLNLLPGDRIGLLGPNGAGKSTLVKLIAGEIEAQSGERKVAKDLNIGYFAQHQLEQLDPKASPLLHLQRLDKKTSDQKLRDFLGGFNFRGERVDEAVAPFSGGEKARLVLALLVWQKPNLLLLDEPTNHLDLEMRHAMNVALQGFEGALILVSHDRHLLRTVADRLLLVDAGGVRDFEEDLDTYPSWLIERRRQLMAEDVGPSHSMGENSAANKKERKRLEAEKRKRLAPLRNREKKLEKQVDSLTEKKDRLEAKLAESEVYEAANKDTLKRLLQEQIEVIQALDAAEEDWMEVCEALEEQA